MSRYHDHSTREVGQEDDARSDFWQIPTDWPVLDADHVHLWRVDLNQTDDLVARYSRVLAPDEEYRAGRFRFERHKRRFVVGRAILRQVLGRYLNLSPAHVAFGYGPKGKPFVDHSTDHLIRFNLSHTEELMVLAVSLNREMGVDVEFMRPISDIDQLADHCFSEKELRTFKQLKSQHRRAAFFRCWTRKEAYVKAIGDGFSAPLKGFDVSFLPEAEARLLRVVADSEEADKWSMCSFEPALDVQGALVAAGNDWNAHFYRWAKPWSECVSVV
jgi:4'-phosphopantetheinyl transferase